MNWFKRKHKTVDPALAASATGTVVAQENIPDPTFAQGMMGPSFGIDPSDGTVVAPFDGTVEMTFPTGHAVGLKRSDGVEELIHIGIDTVNMNGEGFKLLVHDGDTVKKGQPIVTFNPDLVRGKGLNPVVIAVFTELNDKNASMPAEGTNVQAGDTVMEIAAD